MTRKMYDAIYVGNLPAGGDLYAGYDDGNWPDADAIAAAFPGKEVLRITVNPADNKGVIGDGPPDNGSWPDWVNWVRMRRAAGFDPTLNTDDALWSAGKAAFAAAGEPEPHWWIAAYLSSAPDLNNLPAVPEGAVALQCYDYGPYDLSVAADYWPGVDPAPVLPIPPTPKEDTMRTQLVYDVARHVQHFVYIAGDGVYHRSLDEATNVLSSPTRLPGNPVNPDAGVSAMLMKGGDELHVLAEYADTSNGTVAHYWLGLTSVVPWGMATL